MQFLSWVYLKNQQWYGAKPVLIWGSKGVLMKMAYFSVQKNILDNLINFPQK